jgi:hypothetical protein
MRYLRPPVLPVSTGPAPPAPPVGLRGGAPPAVSAQVGLGGPAPSPVPPPPRIPCDAVIGLGFGRPAMPPRVLREELAPLVFAQGASGRRHCFDIHPVGTEFRNIPGVYVFCKRARNANWEAIYIGETVSFAMRLNGRRLDLHHRWSCIQANGATHICTMHVPGPLTWRESVETDLRWAMWTPCNLQ